MPTAYDTPTEFVTEARPNRRADFSPFNAYLAAGAMFRRFSDRAADVPYVGLVAAAAFALPRLAFRYTERIAERADTFVAVAKPEQVQRAKAPRLTGSEVNATQHWAAQALQGYETSAYRGEYNYFQARDVRDQIEYHLGRRLGTSSLWKLAGIELADVCYVNLKGGPDGTSGFLSEKQRQQVEAVKIFTAVLGEGPRIDKKGRIVLNAVEAGALAGLIRFCGTQKHIRFDQMPLSRGSKSLLRAALKFKPLGNVIEGNATQGTTTTREYFVHLWVRTQTTVGLLEGPQQTGTEKGSLQETVEVAQERVAAPAPGEVRPALDAAPVRPALTSKPSGPSGGHSLTGPML